MAPSDGGARLNHPARLGRSGAAALVLLGLAAAATILIAPAGRGARAASDRCRIDNALATMARPLPHVAKRVAAGGTLTIVALGSSSTFGTGASKPEFSYPSRLGALLAGEFPGVRVRVINRGVGGEEADNMVARIDRDVLAAKPDLVIWQVGTNSVLRDRDPAVTAEAVREGIARIKAAGADVMLMNLQYAPAVLQHENYREMLHLLGIIAYAEDVPLLPRFALMRHWAEDGRMPLALMLAHDRLHMSDVSYDCIAQQLAFGIDALARPGI
jgi:lysophospholipase L1-like esterase